MSKILQIRRGSTAEHSNFTGQPGEITIDTDAATIRIHDGQTLGGVPLARADQIGTGGDGSGNGECNCAPFDIASVSPEFWTTLFSAHNMRPSRFLQSVPGPVGNVSYLEALFNDVSDSTDISPAVAECVLVCQTPDAGYAIGDIVRSFGIGARANPRPNLLLDSNGLRARLPVAGEALWVSHKTTGAVTNITNTNWKIKFRIWY
jgi:hypothetical protein